MAYSASMARTTIQVTDSTRDLLNAARVNLYTDAGQVLNADGLVLFLLGVWLHVRANYPARAWLDDARHYLAMAAAARGE